MAIQEDMVQARGGGKPAVAKDPLAEWRPGVNLIEEEIYQRAAKISSAIHVNPQTGVVPPLIAQIDFHGGVGFRENPGDPVVTAEWLKHQFEVALRGDFKAVVIEFDSPGGDGEEMKRCAEVIKEYKQRLAEKGVKTYAKVKNCYSAATLNVVFADHIHVLDGGSIGSIGAYSGLAPNDIGIPNDAAPRIVPSEPEKLGLGFGPWRRSKQSSKKLHKEFREHVIEHRPRLKGDHNPLDGPYAGLRPIAEGVASVIGMASPPQVSLLMITGAGIAASIFAAQTLAFGITAGMVAPYLIGAGLALAAAWALHGFLKKRFEFRPSHVRQDMVGVARDLFSTKHHKLLYMAYATFTGKEAVSLGLADSTGSERDFQSFVEKNIGVSPGSSATVSIPQSIGLAMDQQNAEAEEQAGRKKANMGGG